MLYEVITRTAQLGRLLDDEVGALLLDRREDQPQVGRVQLWRRLPKTGERAPLLRRGADLGGPFAVAAVEERHPRPRSLAHHRKQVMRLLGRQGHGLPRPQRVSYNFV